MPGAPNEGGLEFEQLLADCVRRLLATPADRFGEVARESLRELVLFLGTDRATLQHLRDDELVVRYVWSRSELEIEPLAPITITAHMTWYHSQMRAERAIVLADAQLDLPPEAGPELALIRRIGMRAHVTLPLQVSGRFRWSISTASFRGPRPWTELELRRIRALGGALAAAAERIDLELVNQARLEEIEELHRRLRAETDYLREERTAAHGFEEIVGRSPALLSSLELVDQVAPTPSTVLLLGETGTGKELMARAIHRRSPRRDGPLVSINCAAMPATLIESELFGHEQGAFTGATRARAGRFEIAGGGTLFLDEIGDLPLDVQVKLLRVLQQREFQRLGSSRIQKADVRLIAATHRELEEEVRAGRFRSDLFFRLNVFPIRIPPLRKRPEDVPLLAWAFVERLQGAIGKKIGRIREQDLEALAAYDWPGNVRELENVVERALILSRGDTLTLPAEFGRARAADEPAAASLRLDDHERRHIVDVLAQCRGKISGAGGAAEKLGLHPNTLRSRMIKLGISRPGAG